MKENEETWKEVYWDGEGKTCVEKRRKVKKKSRGRCEEARERRSEVGREAKRHEGKVNWDGQDEEKTKVKKEKY